MGRFSSRFAAFTALAASVSMAATPAIAAPLPAVAQSPVPAFAVLHAQADDGSVVENSRGWGRYPSYGRYKRHRGGVDGGDVLAGVLILGGIAAVAAAASNSKKDRDYRDRDYRGDDYRGDDDGYRNSEPDYRGDDYNYRQSQGGTYSQGRGIDGAVDQCVAEVERKDSVDNVEGVQRSGNGWSVNGTLRDGRSFSCSIDSGGRIGGIRYSEDSASMDDRSGDGRYGDASPGNGQWSDDAYARARDAQGPVYRDGI